MRVVEIESQAVKIEYNEASGIQTILMSRVRSEKLKR